MNLNNKLIEFRKKVRVNQQGVVDSIIRDHSANICVFCGEVNGLTKEHVIPQWVYDRCVKRNFITTTNGSAQAYHNTTVPACGDCNNSILGALEKYLIKKFQVVNLRDDFFSDGDLDLIILWLEIIEYKFHVLDLRRNLNKIKTAEYIPYIGKMPIAMFQGPMDQSPSKVFSNLRSALKTLAVKSKVRRHNSLCSFYTKNPDFHFFHSTNNFIFIELAKYNVAFFYFYKRDFATVEEAAFQAKKILKSEYGASGA